MAEFLSLRRRLLFGTNKDNWPGGIQIRHPWFLHTFIITLKPISKNKKALTDDTVQIHPLTMI